MCTVFCASLVVDFLLSAFVSRFSFRCFCSGEEKKKNKQKLLFIFFEMILKMMSHALPIPSLPKTRANASCNNNPCPYILTPYRPLKMMQHDGCAMDADVAIVGSGIGDVQAVNEEHHDTTSTTSWLMNESGWKTPSTVAASDGSLSDDELLAHNGKELQSQIQSKTQGVYGGEDGKRKSTVGVVDDLFDQLNDLMDVDSGSAAFHADEELPSNTNANTPDDDDDDVHMEMTTSRNVAQPTRITNNSMKVSTDIAKSTCGDPSRETPLHANGPDCRATISVRAADNNRLDDIGNCASTTSQFSLPLVLALRASSPSVDRKRRRRRNTIPTVITPTCTTTNPATSVISTKTAITTTTTSIAIPTTNTTTTTTIPTTTTTAISTIIPIPDSTRTTTISNANALPIPCCTATTTTSTCTNAPSPSPAPAPAPPTSTTTTTATSTTETTAWSSGTSSGTATFMTATSTMNTTNCKAIVGAVVVGDDDKNGPVRDKCMRCSITAKKTPMMRKGPDGCRSLCNACGLKWSRHGIF